MKTAKLSDLVVLIRGAGEMATGVAHRLWRAHLSVCMTEVPNPLAIRREVSFCEALHDGEKTVEGISAKRVIDVEAIKPTWSKGKIPVLVDPEAVVKKFLRPHVVVDAILAKRNLGTRLGDASLVIGLGPGFHAGKNVHLVIETNRGHNLGRLIWEGTAEPDTGTPGEIEGYSVERVLRAPETGRFEPLKKIGDLVEENETVALVKGVPMKSRISGVLRGILRDGTSVQKGLKSGDVDPRGNRDACFTISDKARAIGGSVLEGILFTFNR
ncbi:MAG: EF2563 family selenium-dependent molybdenum hydroxylase system protein [Proteobacteria bacterium]|nr:EF2563 family selenium-dependent molybdenum hydroxylase system protein [Pseudomonadota bacterium]NIS70552.1 EF2563 family selenium-dependent molybdenum hydroxylase system protein [Pseudomonadota bacterium]